MIRIATKADRPELVRLFNGLFPNLDEDLGLEIDKYLSGALQPAVILVAQRPTGGLAGFIEVGTRSYAEGCESSPVPYVEGWYVDEDVRRTGIGRALFAAAEAWARELGFTEIASDVELDNTASIAAHRALGYQETDRIVCFRRAL